MITLALILFLTNVTWADGVGAHTPLFTLEKNRNPQNIMVIYTKLDQNCQVQQSPDSKDQNPIFDFYWLMDHKNFKPVNPLIKREIRKRLEVQSGTADAKSFSVLMNDFKELNSDIKDSTLAVVSHKENGKCVADSILTLGASDKNAKIKLESIYAESKGLFIPSIVAITVKGTDVATGAPISRKYLAK